MIKNRIEVLLGVKLDDETFMQVMEETKRDIVANRILFKQRTTFDNMIDRAIVVVKLFRRCNDGDATRKNK
jgi:hypothetical protein